jgi:hypothetical protein
MHSLDNYKEVYLLTLKKHKDLIKNNKHARDLEKKYHKISHKYQKDFMYNSVDLNDKKQSYCANNQAPTPDLYIKYTSNLSKSQQDDSFLNSFNTVTRVTSKLPKIPNLSKLDKNKFWSPPNSYDLSSTFLDEKKVKLFGPKVKQVRYLIRNLY